MTNWRDIDATEGKITGPAPECGNWHVCTVDSGGEISAASTLRRYGHQAWHPVMIRWNLDMHKKRRVKIARALFPGYLFVSPSAHAERGVTDSGVVVKFIHGRAEAAKISDRIIARLSIAQEAGQFIDWRNAPPRVSQIVQHKIGSEVKVEAGPFVDFTGIVEKQAGDRIIVLVQMLGRAVPVSVGSAEARRVA